MVTKAELDSMVGLASQALNKRIVEYNEKHKGARLPTPEDAEGDPLLTQLNDLVKRLKLLREKA